MVIRGKTAAKLLTTQVASWQNADGDDVDGGGDADDDVGDDGGGDDDDDGAEPLEASLSRALSATPRRALSGPPLDTLCAFSFNMPQMGEHQGAPKGAQGGLDYTAGLK